MIPESMTAGAALLTGLMASGHCLGMCGPMAALGASSDGSQRGRRSLLYNTGRMMSYTAMGATFGYLGFALGDVAGIAHWSGMLRLALGGILLLIGLQLLRRRPGVSVFERVGARLWAQLTPLTHRLRPAENHRDLFVLGLLWGWLPCGMVYSMLAVSAVSGGALQGASIMLAFGTGTLPAMLGVSLAGSRLRGLGTMASRRALGAALIVGGIWLAMMPLYHALPSNHPGAPAHHHALHH